MRIILFLGSGVSIPSNLPNVSQIRDKLRNVPGQPRIQKLLDLLESLDTEYLEFSAPYRTHGTYQYTGQIYRSQTTYEDLFYLSSQIMLNSCGLANDVTANAFAEVVRKKARSFLKGSNKFERSIDLGKLSSQCCQFIEKYVSTILYNREVIGLDLIISLAKFNAVDALNIVTLNHDTLVEQILSNNRIRYCDGFGDADGDVRWFEDRFEQNSKVKVVKLYGSVHWYRAGDYSVLQPSAILDRNLTEWNDGRGNKIRNMNSTPAFLTGVSKVYLYNRGVFSNMFYQFQKALKESQVIIMSGYGWGDVPANFHLDYWLDRDSRNTLVLLHEKPDEIVDRSRELSAMYEARIKTNRIVSIRKWLQNTTLSDLEAYLVS